MSRALPCLAGLVVLAATTVARAEAPPAGPSWQSLFSRGLAPVDAGALPRNIDSLSADECASCHVKEAAEWQLSQHRQSWTSQLFQEAYAAEPAPGCRNCHQPLTAARSQNADSPEVAALRAEGVNCVVCHVRGGNVLATSRSGRAPHPVLVAPVLGTSDFCGGCHQFPVREQRAALPGPGVGEPNQDTLGEWQRLMARGQIVDTCQGCHMPTSTDAKGRRRNSHRFAGGYDPATLARAIAVAASLGERGPGSIALKVVLAAREVGHAVPTGEIFRSLVVEAHCVSEAGESLPGARVISRRLARHFAAAGAEPALPDDDRLILGEPRALELEVPLGDNPARAAVVRYRVVLARRPPSHAGAEPRHESTIVQAELPLSQ